MKPASIIFLIIAAVLALGGLVTMRIAESMAKKEGIELLDEVSEESGEYIFTYEYSGDSIGKIALNLKDAKINIFTTEGKPRIELVNFAEGTYEFSSSNRIITVSNNSDFSSITNIASIAMNFKGLRSIVNYLNVSGLEKTVNIYLSGEYPVKIVDCVAEKGQILIENTKSTADFNIEIAEGNAEIKNIVTSSSVNLKIGEGNLYIDNCTIGNLSLEIGTGEAEIVTSDINSLTAEIESGSIDYGYRYLINDANLDLVASAGKIRIDGEDKGSYYEINDLPTYLKCKITIGKGDITLKSYDNAAD